MHASLALRRTPMINFLGRNRWANHSSQARPHPGAIQSIISSSPFLSALASAPAASSTPSKAASSPAPSSSSSGKPVDYEDDMLIPRRLLLGGYRIEDAEMDAVMSGGATNLA